MNLESLCTYIYSNSPLGVGYYPSYSPVSGLTLLLTVKRIWLLVACLLAAPGLVLQQNVP